VKISPYVKGFVVGGVAAAAASYFWYTGLPGAPERFVEQNVTVYGLGMKDISLDGKLTLNPDEEGFAPLSLWDVSPRKLITKKDIQSICVAGAWHHEGEEEQWRISLTLKEDALGSIPDGTMLALGWYARSDPLYLGEKEEYNPGQNTIRVAFTGQDRIDMIVKLRFLNPNTGIYPCDTVQEMPLYSRWQRAWQEEASLEVSGPTE